MCIYTHTVMYTYIIWNLYTCEPTYDTVHESIYISINLSIYCIGCELRVCVFPRCRLRVAAKSTFLRRTNA